MKVTLVTTWRGKRLHILGKPGYTLCEFRAPFVLCRDWELTAAEPESEDFGLKGLCAACRRKAEENE